MTMSSRAEYVRWPQLLADCFTDVMRCFFALTILCSQSNSPGRWLLLDMGVLNLLYLACAHTSNSNNFNTKILDLIILRIQDSITDLGAETMKSTVGGLRALT